MTKLVNAYNESLSLILCFHDDQEWLGFLGPKDPVHMQIFIDLLYRCIKCNLLKFEIDLGNSDDQTIILISQADGKKTDVTADTINTPEEFFTAAAQTYQKREHFFVWQVESFSSTELLDKLIEECDLLDPQDFIKEGDYKSNLFKEKIEAIFEQHGMPINFEKSL